MKTTQLLRACFVVLVAISTIPFAQAECCSKKQQCTDGFTKLFNGEDWDGWYLKLRKNDDVDLANKVFAIEDGIIHIFNDEFPNEYELGTGENASHGMAYTKKKYSKYVLRFEYKWGTKVANNFAEWQYDAGVYYHVIDDKIWPDGMEYQVRYDHIKNNNHTGDIIGTELQWYPSDITKGKDAIFQHPQQGGKLQSVDGWMHLASTPKEYHALDDKWNQCEVIAMGDAYIIHKLNGEVINIAQNLKYSEGVIGFQAETAEIFYRNIEIKELDEALPIEAFVTATKCCK